MQVSPNGYGSERGSWGSRMPRSPGAGLSERRYGYYATGDREPNLATLLRICEVLAASPNDLLLPERKPPRQSGRDRLLARISTATDALTAADLELAACQLECLVAHQTKQRAGVSREQR
jgi:hypothetical protein